MTPPALPMSAPAIVLGTVSVCVATPGPEPSPPPATGVLLGVLFVSGLRPELPELSERSRRRRRRGERESESDLLLLRLFLAARALRLGGERESESLASLRRGRAWPPRTPKLLPPPLPLPPPPEPLSCWRSALISRSFAASSRARRSGPVSGGLVCLPRWRGCCCCCPCHRLQRLGVRGESGTRSGWCWCSRRWPDSSAPDSIRYSAPSCSSRATAPSGSAWWSGPAPPSSRFAAGPF
mmetsp:Transcript_41693/g.96688  ORF Transcript_41693/g.96688 Transcript_41693/m.96688 type:complete len:239 (+) Transcript_41693:866-1582(+)